MTRRMAKIILGSMGAAILLMLIIGSIFIPYFFLFTMLEIAGLAAAAGLIWLIARCIVEIWG